MTGMMHSGYSGKVKAAKGRMIHQVHADDANGLPAYYFIAVDASKRKAFDKALKKDDCDLAQYGDIVLSGYGVPTNKDKRFMKERHDYDVQE